MSALEIGGSFTTVVLLRNALTWLVGSSVLVLRAMREMQKVRNCFVYNLVYTTNIFL